MRHFFVAGSHPALSFAEIRAVRPDLANPIMVGPVIIVDTEEWDGAVLMKTLGGVVKLGDIVDERPEHSVTASTLADAIPPRGRSLDFGLTVFGSPQIAKLPIHLKKELKRRGMPSRWVTGKGAEGISPAAVSKMGMDTDGTDLTVAVHGRKAYVGRTTHVQDADAWSLRDYGRPARSDVEGMLPPKLARIMVNLSSLPLQKREGPREGVLLDPFCGSGTILMEAALVTNAARIIGSDIAQQQIADTKQNNAWLIEQRVLSSEDAHRLDVFLADARTLSKKISSASVDAVVTEGYLGPLLRGNEGAVALERNAQMIRDLWMETLKELHKVLKPGGRAVCVWPMFQTRNGKASVDLEKDLSRLGFRLSDPTSLIYQRPNQHVARRIVVLKRS